MTQRSLWTNQELEFGVGKSSSPADHLPAAAFAKDVDDMTQALCALEPVSLQA
jgi:hypothetical protein